MDYIGLCFTSADGELQGTHLDPQKGLVNYDSPN